MKTKHFTVQEVLDILASQAQQISEFAKQMTESNAKFEQQMTESNAKFEEHKLQAAKEIREVRQELGGIGRSQGEVAERYFYSAIKKNMKLLHVELNEIEANINKYVKSLNLREQYDLILTNTNVIVVVEVKYKMRVREVEWLYKDKIPNFKKLFPERKNFELIGAVAAFVFEENAIKLAKQYGFLILTREDKHLEILNENYISY